MDFAGVRRGVPEKFVGGTPVMGRPEFPDLLEVSVPGVPRYGLLPETLVPRFDCKIETERHKENEKNRNKQAEQLGQNTEQVGDSLATEYLFGGGCTAGLPAASLAYQSPETMKKSSSPPFELSGSWVTNGG